MMTENLVLQVFAESAILQQWRGRRLTQEWNFSSPEQSRDQLTEIIANNPNSPVTLVIDTADEELRTALIPKIMGSARSLLQQRTLLQAFPNEEFRALASQGTVRGERRDEQLLLIAITQSELLKSWLNIMQEQNALVQKVTTASMVLAQLTKLLGGKNEYELVIYQHRENGLRQLFLHNGQLGLSRLSIPLEIDQTVVDQCLTETTNTHQYLKNSKVIPLDATLTLRVLHHDHMVAELTTGLEELPQAELQLIGFSQLARQFSLTLPDTNLRAEHFLGWVASSRQHKLMDFAPTTVTSQHRRFLHSRWTVYAATVATIAMLIWSTTELFAVWEISRRADEQQMLLTRWQQLEQDALANTIPTDAPPLTMKQATELVHHLTAERRFPQMALREVAGALAASPELRFRKIEWAVGDNALTNYHEETPAVDEFDAFTEKPDMTPAKFTRETLFLELQIEPFSGDYLAAQQQAKLTADALKKIPVVRSVEMVSAPLNVNSPTDFSERIALVNDSKNRPLEARFQLVLTLDSSSPAPVSSQ
ncbi:MAG: hypothetical protein DRQ54_01015 [Gammaproteobacteria bacterium]|nr:MAG: hypothetical protein DRQ54_01015 [Gammaproteobacteria bacterium]